jgi:uncharacterized protein (DUF1501 family)
MSSRRSLLLRSAALAATTLLPRPGPGGRAHAASASAADLKFLFLFNRGGWDPTRVYAPSFTNPDVDMESGATTASVGGIAFVDHPDRPSVRAFFESWHDRCLVLNGMMVRSIAHDICTTLCLTGTTSGTNPDWPAIIADAGGDRYVLPYLVLSGPSVPGALGAITARSGSAGQLQALLSGDVLTWTDSPVAPPSSASIALVDELVARRVAARSALAVSPGEVALYAALTKGVDRVTALQAVRDRIEFSGGTTFAQQASVAVDVLSAGVSRCVMMDFPNHVFPYSIYTWDSHADNDTNQSFLFEGLFASLDGLLASLAAAPGQTCATLADETVVVVLSEMGRTPRSNAFSGKDHWPHTSAMILGPGVTGSRVVGAYDDGFAASPVDPASAEVSADGVTLSAEALGATLLTLAGVDAGAFVGAEPLWGVLE